jgi:hypothetical protein
VNQKQKTAQLDSSRAAKLLSQWLKPHVDYSCKQCFPNDRFFTLSSPAVKGFFIVNTPLLPAFVPADCGFAMRADFIKLAP